MILPWRPMVPPVGFSGPAISTSLTEAEAAWLVENAQGNCLEIGSAFGFSTICIARDAVTVLAIDPHQVHASYENCLWNLNAYGLRDKVSVVQMDSTYLHTLPDDVFDFCFIDGDHTYLGVKHDALEAWRVVGLGGLVAFHDYGEDTCPGVKQLIDELDRSNFQEQVDSMMVFKVQ